MTFSGTIKRTFLLLIAVAGVLPAFSQRADSIRSARVDSIYNSLNDTATWRQELDFVNSLNWTEASDSDIVRPQTAEKKRSRMTWKQKEEETLMEMRSKTDAWEPDPRKAVWMSLVFPGGGQIYNRKYWKLPVVYGGYVGCLYALTWNQNTYTEYRKAYVDIMDNDPETKSYEDFLPPHYEIDTSMEDWLKDIFKQRKDKYRRYRDLSIFAFAGMYVVSAIDAYVDAELSHFDISPDLSMDLEPNLMFDRLGSLNAGFSLAFHF